MSEATSELGRLTFSPEEVARALGISAVTVRRLLKVGKLRGIRAHNRWMIPRSAIEEFITPPPAPEIELPE
jgi:excisionase family DNA binding protein